MPKPNILWIFTDQHRASAMSCAGDPNVQTPHIDRLAAEGIRFTNAYANSPMCAPFRGSLYTGQYISTHGVNCLFKPLDPNKQPLLPQVLQDNGYHTSHMGKWHLSGGDCPSHFVSPYFRPGWDDWMGWENSNRPFNTEFGKGDMPIPLYTMDGYQTDVMTDMFLDWLKEYNEDKPWFHVMSYESPHPPNQAPDEYMQRYENADIQLRPNVDLNDPKIDGYIKTHQGYYAQICNMDDNVGRIIKALEDQGQLDNTIIFYFADHGDMMGSHGRRNKEVAEQESSNIPFLVRCPGLIKSQVTDAFISCVDIMPSLLGLLGIDIPDSVEGQDCSDTICGIDNDGTDSVLFQFDRPFFSFKEHHELHYRGIRHGPWKYIVHYFPERNRLYNLDEDPYEMHNRIHDDKYQDIASELHEHLQHKLNTIKDDFILRTH